MGAKKDEQWVIVTLNNNEKAAGRMVHLNLNGFVMLIVPQPLPEGDSFMYYNKDQVKCVQIVEEKVARAVLDDIWSGFLPCDKDLSI